MVSRTVWIKDKNYKEIIKLVKQTKKTVSAVVNDLIETAFQYLESNLQQKK